MTYAEVADRLGVTPEAARSRAKRLGSRRQMGNDGRALVLAALEPRPPGEPPVTGPSPPGRKAADNAVHEQIARLEGELAGMREALAEARGRAGAAEVHIETLKAQLTASEARVTAADARAADKAARTAEAIAAFKSLAQRLEALVEARRPLWHRLLWRA
jgi:hypothetical protein